jgi:hypothetical protein
MRTDDTGIFARANYHAQSVPDGCTRQTRLRWGSRKRPLWFRNGFCQVSIGKVIYATVPCPKAL